MRARLMLVLVAGSLVASANPSADCGRVGWKVPLYSKWVATWGRKGKAKLERASVTFKGSNTLEIEYQVKTKDGFLGFRISYHYQSDVEAGLGKIYLGGKVAGTFEPVGNRLKLGFADDWIIADTGRMEWDRKLLLLLIRSK
jgi:hypothetical protein